MSTHQYTAVTHVYTIHFALRNAITNCILHLHQMWQPTIERPGSPASHTAAEVRRSILWYVAIRCCMSWCVVVPRTHLFTSVHINAYQHTSAHISTHQHLHVAPVHISTHQHTAITNVHTSFCIAKCTQESHFAFAAYVAANQPAASQPTITHSRRSTLKYVEIRRSTS